MERFIGWNTGMITLIIFNLKSSMERFIGLNQRAESKHY